MKQKLSYILILITLLISCGKEYSFENPLQKGTIITIGANCTPSKILDYDTILRRNVAALQYTFNQTGNYIATVSQIDSITNQNIFQKSINLIGDTLRIDNQQYFLIDITNNYRVREFVGFENPFNINSPKYIQRFFYNATNQIVTKQVINPGQTSAIFTQTDYSYTAGNLTSIKTKIPLNNITYFEATISYNTTKQPKNYIVILPDATSLKPYLSAMNFGAKSINEPTKIVINNSDQLTGTLINTTTTEFKNYVYSSDNYVLKVDMDGFNINALPFANSRNVFQYFCR